MMSPLLQLIAGETLTHGTGLAAAVAGALSSTIEQWLEIAATTLVLAAAGSVALVLKTARHEPAEACAKALSASPEGLSPDLRRCT